MNWKMFGIVAAAIGLALLVLPFLLRTAGWIFGWCEIKPGPKERTQTVVYAAPVETQKSVVVVAAPIEQIQPQAQSKPSTVRSAEPLGPMVLRDFIWVPEGCAPPPGYIHPTNDLDPSGRGRIRWESDQGRQIRLNRLRRGW